MKLSQSLTTLDPQARTNLLILFITGLLFWISVTILLPTLPAYVEDLGGTRQQIGLVMGSFAIGLIGSRTWLGQLADSRGRKIVVIIGTVIGAIAPLGYLLVHSIYPLMGVRAFHGISIAAFTTGYNALVTDISPVKQRGEIIGYMNLSVPVGMAIGPALAGLFQHLLGYNLIFTFSAFSGVFACLLAYQVTEKNSKSVSLSLSLEEQPQRNFWQMLTHPALAVPALVLLMIGLLFGALATFLPLFMRHYAGLFYSAAAIAGFIPRILVGQASDRYGRGIFISGSLVCYGLSMLLLATHQSPNAVVIAAILEGTGAGILIPMVIALISDRSYESERGRVFAVCVGGFDVGIAISAPLLGLLPWDYSQIFILSAGFAGVALILFLSHSNPNLSHSLRFALGKGRDHYAVK